MSCVKGPLLECQVKKLQPSHREKTYEKALIGAKRVYSNPHVKVLIFKCIFGIGGLGR